MKRAVFLDRDGVINRPVIKNGKPYPPSGIDELEVLPGVAESLKKLKTYGFVLLVVSNQPDVRRGTTSREAIDEINAKLMGTLPLDGIYCCFHDDQDGCTCRKPMPGLLHQAAREHDVDLEYSFMIGDRWKDIEAGHNAGCQTIWIKSKYAEPTPRRAAHFVAESLADASAWILQNKGFMERSANGKTA